ncbi:MAG: hypothetical protein BWK78_08080 [Thiotrichaceae bacterium IS1]|nr:MAG: hypothetical protein BWK78_08080 [Thiotrichaceae bacterium IS1]
MQAQGYQGSGTGENIDGGGASNAEDIFWSHWGFMVDCFNISGGYHNIGHRLNILNTDSNEVGLGNFTNAEANGHITQDFGVAASRIFLVGVVYQDQNGNSFYDPGEGLGGVTVMPSEGEYYAVTSSSGGYAIPVDSEETRQLEVPTSLSYDDSTGEQRGAEYEAFRDSYLANPDNLTHVNLTLTASGGTLGGPLTKTVSLIKPVLVDVKFVYQGYSKWWFGPFMAGGSNVKQDFNTQDATSSPVSILPTLDQTFSGGIAVNGQSSQQRATLNLSDTVEVAGDII